MIEEVTLETVTYNEPPHRFEAGTPPILEAIALGAAVDYLSRLDRAAVAAHEARLRDLATARISEIEGVRILGNAPDKASIVAFVLDGAHPHDIAQILDRHGVAVRAGHHCAQPLMRRLGVTATARASFGLYNTEDEVELFAQALAKARAMLM
jgi:cysteine desulfurase/selenocysteine lyase